MSRPASRKPCPLCAAPAHVDHAPFCSRGCRDRDLLNWLGEGYRIPGPAASPHENDETGLDSRDPRG
ncbi:DNA gyrase inhibitor YacG [Sphingomonas sp. CFBP 13720]|uniref:DNA gyrase inhibitor YacG n=1 Tax=Sphingomonas sp. CFBP 13720 TaxID=2775302 RepID=UPI001781701C|nr:DNA gyrase inhibitor YacG [Sphingomonas sp. CFBP 13720]MBD8678044.1 DNA gyrase inhibitor YacG [Sphingomonas sp. CFBP 13720]